MIQGSVSLTKEDGRNCTEVLTGFHNQVDKYLDWRESAGIADPAGCIEGWHDNKDWPKAAQAAVPGAKWEKIICKQGDVRITHPMVPHGSTGPATAKRLTMLPWLVLERGGVMEIPAMGSYDDISKAHRDHTVPPCTPSGYPNKYSSIN